MSGISLSPSSIRRLEEPSRCDRRIWLKAQGVEGLPPSGLQELLFEAGADHEETVLDQLREGFPGVVDLGGPDNEDCELATSRAIEVGDGSLLYQAGLRTQTVLDGAEVTVLGYPDFLMPDGDAWVIGDAKLTGTTLNKPRKDGSQTPKSDKKYIHNQLQLYAWLMREIYGLEVSELRIYTGRGTVELVEDDGGEEALATLVKIMRLRELGEEPFEAVGLSKCQTKKCEYRERCWPRAEQEKSLGVVPGVSVSQVELLRENGLVSYDQALAEYDERSLAEMAKEGGGDDVKKRAWARRVLESAEALETGAFVRRQDANGGLIPLPDEISSDPNYVMFDLEGEQARAGELVDIYLWGMQVFGRDKGEYLSALAGFEEGSVEKAWREFLALARAILDKHAGIRFVHWANYEKEYTEKYIEEFGDDEHGTGAEVLSLLLDLRPIVEDSVALPATSYSLKVVEKCAGFERAVDEIGRGDESIVAYAAAKKSGDPATQEATLASIAAYNCEDLEGTWVVQRWLADEVAPADRKRPSQTPSEYMRKHFHKSPKSNEKLA